MQRISGGFDWNTSKYLNHDKLAIDASQKSIYHQTIATTDQKTYGPYKI